MWVVVFLTGCGGDATQLRWSFADHRTCAEANVVTIAVRDGDREIARVACSSERAEVSADALVVEALGYHGTPLYRGHAVVRSAETSVTLRYVGGRD